MYYRHPSLPNGDTGPMAKNEQSSEGDVSRTGSGNHTAGALRVVESEKSAGGVYFHVLKSGLYPALSSVVA